MPNLQDRLTHAKDLAEWKVSQGKRIKDAQVKITDFEKQVQRSKQLLSETTYALHTQNKLQDEELLALCADIDSIYRAIERSEEELERIRNEETPELIDSSKIVFTGLVCPVCGKKLTGKFCPIDGVEGIRIASPTTPSVTAAFSARVCPKCGKDLKMKFCNDCGVEGVLKTKAAKAPSVKKAETPPADNKPVAKQRKAAPSKSKTVKTELVCPKCKKVLNMKFCNDCGVAGVLKPVTATKTKNIPPSKPAAAKKTTPKSTSAKKSSTK